MAIVYTLIKKDSTEEYHLFKGQINPDGESCTKESKSICKMMDKPSKYKYFFACENEQTAREQCAKKGRSVCGVCISDLYQTFTK